MIKNVGYAALAKDKPLERFAFESREPEVHDVVIDLLFCGICHTDIHYARNEHKSSIYPLVPGHEMVGRVSRVGDKVTLFKPNDLVGVGPTIGSCGVCASCKEGLEQYCEKGFTFVYSTVDTKTGMPNYGGFSQHIVVNEKYVFKLPESFTEQQLPAVAPLMCAGITVYSPLRYWKIGKGSKVGVVGIGGLGHLAVKFAHAMGAQVVEFTTTAGKIDDAQHLGAHEAVLSTDDAAMKKHEISFDFIIDTLPVSHNLEPYLKLLKREGILCLVGLPKEPNAGFNARELIFKRRYITGSLMGSIAETKEMLDFCAQHNILADVEVIPVNYINKAFERIINNDVRYRFVIDLNTLR